MLPPRQPQLFRWGWVHPEGWYLQLSFRYMVSHLLFLPLIFKLHYPLNLTRNPPEELSPPAVHQWGVASLETKAGRARLTPPTPGFKERWHCKSAGWKRRRSRIARQLALHASLPHLNPKGKPHTLLLHCGYLLGGASHSSQGCPNSSRSQNPCSSAKPPGKSVFISILVLNVQDSSEKKPPHSVSAYHHFPWDSSPLLTAQPGSYYSQL